MRKLMTTLSALALSSTAAFAGGMVVPQEPIITAPTPAPMLRHAYDWTGGYAGVGLTFGRASHRVGDDENNNLGDAWPGGSGFGIGGLAGFNWQAGNMVYGVEGHLSGHRMRGSATVGDIDVRTNVRSLASLRGRVGVAQDRTLFFVTAGPAIGSLRHTATFADDTSASESRRANGWMIGIGAEHAMGGGWNLRGDLEHYRFRGRDFTTGGADFANVRTRVNLARVSAVFRF